MNAANYYRKSVMSNAWKLAKEGAAKFGGSARSYLIAAMRDAWASAKRNPWSKATAEVMADLMSKPLPKPTKDRLVYRTCSFWNPW